MEVAAVRRQLRRGLRARPRWYGCKGHRRHSTTRILDSLPDLHEVALVVVPEPESCCCCWRALITSVPSGPYVLGQTCGEDKGLVTPGANWCWWRWQQVAFVVSKQTVTYNAAAKDAPTKDSVFVNIDLSINLKIGPDLQRVKDFVYKMGAERLDAYLNFQVRMFPLHRERSLFDPRAARRVPSTSR